MKKLLLLAVIVQLLSGYITGSDRDLLSFEATSAVRVVRPQNCIWRSRGGKPAQEVPLTESCGTVAAMAEFSVQQSRLSKGPVAGVNDIHTNVIRTGEQTQGSVRLRRPD